MMGPEARAFDRWAKDARPFWRKLFDVTGRPSGVSESFFKENRPETLSFIREAMDYYEIDVSRIAFVTPQLDLNAGKCLGLVRMIDHGCIEFGLSTLSLSVEDAKFAVLHEIGHLIQIADGRLWYKRPDWDPIWHTETDVRYITCLNDYYNLPWELDANMFAFKSPLNRNRIPCYSSLMEAVMVAVAANKMKAVRVEHEAA